MTQSLLLQSSYTPRKETEGIFAEKSTFHFTDDIVLPTGKRTSGLLLHPISLPGPYGMGDLGTAARPYVDFLVLERTRTYATAPDLRPRTLVQSP
jgi:hypothetical protein